MFKQHPEARNPFYKNIKQAQVFKGHNHKSNGNCDAFTAHFYVIICNMKLKLL